MAAFLLAAVPLFLIFLFTMRWFVKGLSEGAVNG
jgi:ABC-type maltose transport system permease subunit